MEQTRSLAGLTTRAAMAAALLGSSLLVLTACNTAAGFGQDVSATGQAVTNSAEKVKQGL